MLKRNESNSFDPDLMQESTCSVLFNGPFIVSLSSLLVKLLAWESRFPNLYLLAPTQDPKPSPVQIFVRFRLSVHWVY